MTKPDEDPPKKFGISDDDIAGPSTGGSDDAPVPKLPRGSGFKLSTPHLMRIGMIVVTLFALVVLQKPCSNAVSRFVTTFGGGESAKEGNGAAPSTPAATANPHAPATPATPSAAPATAPSTVTGPDRSAPAGAPPIQYERLTPSMTDEELRAAIERAKRRAAAAEAASGPGSAAPPPTPTPTPSPPSPSPSAGSGGQ